MLQKHDDAGFLSYHRHTHFVRAGTFVVPGAGRGGRVLGEILGDVPPPFLVDVSLISVLF